MGNVRARALMMERRRNSPEPQAATKDKRNPEIFMSKLIPLAVAAALALTTSQVAFAQDKMSKDGMTKDSMSKDGMKKDDGMKKSSTSEMSKSGMSKDGMSKDDGMSKGAKSK
jgi:pentapeptide MXKDX repeat protein